MEDKTFTHSVFAQSELSHHGLNLQAILDINALPDNIQTSLATECEDLNAFRQLILFGHGGRRLWDSVSSFVDDAESADPIDTYTIKIVQDYFTDQHPEHRYQFVYPGSTSVPLQQLGALVGWHHDSPFKVGVNSTWGSWFAYRALLLVDSEFKPSKKVAFKSPCEDCEAQPCIQACPASAMSEGELNLQRCVDYRKTSDSLCRAQCLARLACPVATEHRYSDAQMSYHYLRSMRMIEHAAVVCKNIPDR